jgi:microsomal dipeptidase-like Zn-dependent dipeptidase
MGFMWGSPWYPPNAFATEVCGDGSETCGATSFATCGSGSPVLCTPDATERRELALPMCHRARHEARWPQAQYKDDTRHSSPGVSAILALPEGPSGSGTGGNVVGCTVPSDCYHFSRGWNPDTQRYQMPMRPFMDIIHQQMYWEWVKRAYEGGLRLIVTDVGHSMAIEALMNDAWWLNNEQGSDILYGHTTDDWYAVRRQTCAVKKMVSLVPEIAQFAEIAYSPQQAREIIGRGKLAVVLGAEVDSLGSLRPNLFSGNPDKELDALQALGVRKITPIHLVDNANGGSAVYDPIFYGYTDALNLANGMQDGVNLISVANLADKQNSSKDDEFRLNQFLFDHGSSGGAHNLSDDLNDRIAHVGDGQVLLTGAYNRFFDANGNNCGDPDVNKPDCWTATNFFQQEIVDTPCTRTPQGDCLNQRFDVNATKQRPVAMWNLFLQTQHQTVFAPLDAPPPTDPLQQYLNSDTGAARNFRGLSSDGAAYLESAARRALLVDIDHMGEKSQKDVLSSSPVWTATCSGGLSFNQSTADCQKNAYPVIATHTGIREARGVAWNAGDKVERQLDTPNLAAILRSGGTIGIGAGYQTIDTPPLPRLSTLAYPDDCPGSAKALGSQYLWYIKKTETVGVFDRFGMPRPSAWLAGGVSLGSDLNGFAVQLNGRYNDFNGYGLTDTARCDGNAAFGDPSATLDPNQTARALAQDQQENAVYYGDSPIPPEATTSALGLGTAPPQHVLHKLFFTPGAVPDVQLGGGGVDGGGVPIPPFGVIFDMNGFDFNKTGVVNIGQEPDLLQDMVNPSRTSLYNFREMQYQMRHLFHGAEDFIEAWEKAQSICEDRTGGSPTCTPAPPNDAESCDMWTSDVDHIPTSNTGGTDDTPSCMDRCGQTLTFIDKSNNPASCDCFFDPVVNNASRLCADFKPWCKYTAHVEYNCLPDPSLFPFGVCGD